MLPLVKNAIKRGFVPSMRIARERMLHFLRTGYLHTSERVCPEYPDEIFQTHVKVYRFLVQFVKHKRILEIGCGTGYGAHMLADYAASITAIDCSRRAVKYASRHYAHDKIRHIVMKAERLDFPSQSFDVVLSSEVFEHLHGHEAHVRELARVLRNGGLCFIATPNPEITDGHNEFHTKEWPFEELRDLLSRYFSQVAIIETSGQPPNPEQWESRKRRIEQGQAGIDPHSDFSVFGAHVDRSHLDNPRSFFAFASHQHPQQT